MKVYPNVDFYILKLEITGKQSKKHSKNANQQQPTEKQKSSEYRNISKMRARFLHLFIRGRFAPLYPRQSHHCC